MTLFDRTLDAAPTPARDPTAPSPARRRMVVLGVLPAWAVLWSLTPGLLGDGVGSLVTSDPAGVVLVESALALLVAAVLALAHRDWTRELFAAGPTRWLYALPVAAGVVLPFHYGLPLPLAVYVVWMAASVLWQNYLTFGLLQGYLRRCFGPRVAVGLVAVVFALGHVLWLPERFGLGSPLAAAAMLVLGLVLASLRAGTRALHANLALHLGFYLVFA